MLQYYAGSVHRKKGGRYDSEKKLNILLADDGSQHAQAAVELLQNLPIPTKSRIWILRAFNFGQIPSLGEFEATLERSKNQLVGRCFSVDAELKLGCAAEMIPEKAEAYKQDLIMAVSRKLVHYSDCSVLIVKEPGKE